MMAGRESNCTPPVSLNSICAVCSKGCRRLRCSRCRQVSYCSVTCQRAHWKAGHRSKCRALSPQDAWQELQHELIQLSPEEALQRYQIVQQEIKRLDQEPQPAKRTEQPCRRESGIENNEPRHKSSAAKKDDYDTAPVSVTGTQKIIFMPERESSMRQDWIYVVEEMPNISSYQVTMWPRETAETVPHLDEVALSVQVDSHGNTNVSLRFFGKVSFLAQFPGRIVTTPEPRDLVQCQSDCISLRLQSQDNIGNDRYDNSGTSLASIRSIRCRFCEQNLLIEACNIKKVLQLPYGNWDEVTDYLICYNGQPAVDFSSSSTSAKEHLAFEDSSVIVLHCNSVRNAICVLAVEGYGVIDTEDYPAKNDDSATCRGPRAWRDSVGGATLCCSRCCATLGFASLTWPETYRLLKHRLSADNDVQRWESLYTCPSFVACEMVRYAESKAIFTFVVAVRSEGKVKEHRKCILLKLLSWDTRRAKSTESPSSERDSQVDVLNFQKVLKVIYEVVSDQDTAVYDDTDPMRWTWGGVDLCCIRGMSPIQESQQSDASESFKQARVASVRLWLSPEEWNELFRSLVANSRAFSKAVTDATITVKLGLQTKKHNDDTIGLSTLPLL